jgi:hypothetical protein
MSQSFRKIIFIFSQEKVLCVEIMKTSDDMTDRT